MHRTPRAHLLWNGVYRVLLSEAGGGGSFWNGMALTRWTADPVRDADGLFLYVRDRATGRVMSPTAQPMEASGSTGVVAPGPGVVRFVRSGAGLQLALTVGVAPDRAAEVRLLTLTNESDRVRDLEVTTYCEVALNHPEADAAHPAFSKLFVETDYDAPGQALLARRRPRAPDDSPLWMGHALVGGPDAGPPERETDRARFLGRGRTVADPAALDRGVRLGGQVANPVDPVLALRRAFRLEPGASCSLAAVLAAGSSRESVTALLSEMARRGPDAVLADCRAVQRRQVAELPSDLVERLPDLVGALAYGECRAEIDAPLPGSAMAALDRVLALGWSGRRPLVVSDLGTDPSIRERLDLLAHWCRRAGLPVDRVVLPADLPDEVRWLAQRAATLGPWSLESATRPVQAAAPVDGSRRPEAHLPSAPLVLSRPAPPRSDLQPTGQGLTDFNGYGGFDDQGAYEIRMGWEAGRLRRPPLPWSNVIANPDAGLIATEAGIGVVWSANSRENRLTPWSNDPVVDPPSVSFFVQDLEAGLYWSPCPGGVAAPGSYRVRHEPGATTWLHESHDLRQEITAFVPPADGVAIARCCVTNRSDRIRRLGFVALAELVLGAARESSRRFVTTGLDPARGAILAVNPCRGEFSDRVAFASLRARPDRVVEASGDRPAAVGIGRSSADPVVAAERAPLESRFGAGLDPCAAFRVAFDLAPGATEELDLLIGEGADPSEASRLLERYRDPAVVGTALAATRARWRELAERVQVSTPEPALDPILNRWLVYQNLSCRLWGRSAFYQSGGAFGFRDQLQDALALVHVDPSLAREQIVLHAGRQFPEGDVLHWWHPPTDKGIRTRFADDLLWLPYAAAFYVHWTGDEGVLDRTAPFVTGPELVAGEDEAFVFPGRTSFEATVYEHCCRALDRSLTRGRHGLPLMGSGDWNDGMNRVGREGRGESVWLGFFLHRILLDFLPLVEARGDEARARRYRSYREELVRALNAAGWDGAWYRRAYYDDGTALGSRSSDECQIDAIAQAWAVISQAAPRERAEAALDAVERRLVDREANLVRLLTPPFDRTLHDPGYIRGYLPGVRENGGQYTHGALWVVKALAELGRTEDAAALLALLSPAAHGGAGRIAAYQVEPFVVAADVYGVAPHVGRGGWTWYTGSAGWMYRVALESILGMTMERGKVLRIQPAIPSTWPGFEVRYRVPGRDTLVALTLTQSRPRPATTRAHADRGPLAVEPDGSIRVPVDGGQREIVVRIEAGADLGPRYQSR